MRCAARATASNGRRSTIRRSGTRSARASAPCVAPIASLLPDRGERPLDEEVCDDAGRKRREAADADRDPQGAPGRVAPLGLQPGDEQREPFQGIDDPQGDIPDGFSAVVDDVRGRRKRILGRGILRDPGVFLSGEQGSQAGEQLVASGRVFKRLDQAAQMRFFGGRIGRRLGRLPRHEGAPHLLSMSERGAQRQQQRDEDATSIDAPPHDRHPSGTKEELGPWRSSQSTRSIRPPCPAAGPRWKRHSEPDLGRLIL